MEYRIKNRFSKKAFAELLGWTPMYYGRFENSNLLPKSSHAIEKFAKITDNDVEFIEQLIKLSLKELDSE